MTRRGFSLVEVMVAVAVLAIAIFAILAALAQSATLRQASAETEIAGQILQARLAQVRTASDDMTQIVAQEGPFTPTDPRLKTPVGTVAVLTEADASTAFAADLDKDGDVDAADLYDLDGDGTPGEGAITVPGDTSTGSLKSAYDRLVPVRITLSWQSVAGNLRTMTIESMIYPSGT